MEPGYQLSATPEKRPTPSPAFPWRKLPEQARWRKIGLVFLLFYASEALLFWQGLAWAEPLMRLPLFVPFIYPLGFWGLFSYTIYWIQRPSVGERRTGIEQRFRRWQNTLLTVGIGVGVVGTAFVVMRGSGSPHLGHVALFFALFLAATVLGALDLNIGWLAAAGAWLVTALGLFAYPETWDLFPRFRDDDIWIGLSATLGFFLIGAFPWCVDRGRLQAADSGEGPGSQAPPTAESVTN